MKITIVGHWGAYPEKNEATSCYLIEDNDYKLLIDCGSGALSHLQQYICLEELDAVLLSHYHHDHVADIGSLQYCRQIAMNLNKTKQPLQIYGHAYEQQEFAKLDKPPYVKSYLYNEQSQLEIGPFNVTFQKTDHKQTCFAMRIEAGGKTLTYSADSSYKDEIITFAKDSDLFICEASFYKGQDAKPYGHMNSIEAAMIAQKANVKQLILTHLPHFGLHQQLVEEAKTVFRGEIRLAEKGLVIEP